MSAEAEILKFTVQSKSAADHLIEFLEHTQPFKTKVCYVKVIDLKDTVMRTFNAEHLGIHRRSHDGYEIELTVCKRDAEQIVKALGEHFREVLHLNKNNKTVTNICIERQDMTLDFRS